MLIDTILSGIIFVKSFHSSSFDSIQNVQILALRTFGNMNHCGMNSSVPLLNVSTRGKAKGNCWRDGEPNLPT